MLHVSNRFWKAARIGFVLLFAVTMVASAEGAIVSGGGSWSIDYTIGGVPTFSTGVVAIPASDAALLTLGGGTADGFGASTTGFLALKRSFGSATVFIPTAPPSPVTTFLSQTDPGATMGESRLLATFTATFATDVAGLPATPVSIAYPLAWIDPPGNLVSFEASVSYSSVALGPLGVLDLDFFPAAPSGSPGVTITGSSFTIPVLPSGDVLTLTGFFDLKVNAAGASAEIDIFGVPEPGSLGLVMIVGVALGGMVARRRRAV